MITSVLAAVVGVNEAVESDLALPGKDGLEQLQDVVASVAGVGLTLTSRFVGGSGVLNNLSDGRTYI